VYPRLALTWMQSATEAFDHRRAERIGTTDPRSIGDEVAAEGKWGPRMTAFPPIEAIRDRFPTRRSNLLIRVEGTEGLPQSLSGSAICARRGVYFDPVKMNSRTAIGCQ
jgi:hypothetical protein